MNKVFTTGSGALQTSLEEIRSFYPCAAGWKTILAANAGRLHADLFPLEDCLKSNSVADVCWLLGKRKAEIAICVGFVAWCVVSVSHLRNRYAAYAPADAAAGAAAGAYAAAYAAIRNSAVEAQKAKLAELIRNYTQEQA